jgi:hypothetical protein
VSRAGALYVARRFYLPLNVQLPNNFFTQAVIVAGRWRGVFVERKEILS